MKSFIISLLLITSSAMAHEGDHHGDVELYELFELNNALEVYSQDYEIMSCTKANQRQIASVNEGNRKKNQFLSECARSTSNSPWCGQLIRPNPSSLSQFRCTYGNDQTHQLIHPDESTWKYAFQSVRLVESLENNSICIQQIYNWWRPEPYNKNVGGAAGRHPYGTSVDVRFCSKTDQEKAHRILCAWRKKGSLRALGYYSGTALHLGIGDKTANTWGKTCP